MQSAKITIEMHDISMSEQPDEFLRQTRRFESCLAEFWEKNPSYALPWVITPARLPIKRPGGGYRYCHGILLTLNVALLENLPKDFDSIVLKTIAHINAFQKNMKYGHSPFTVVTFSHID